MGDRYTYVGLAAQALSQLNDMRRTYDKTAWQLNDAFMGHARVPISNDMFGVSKSKDLTHKDLFNQATDNETRAHDRFHKLKRQYKQLDHKLDRLMHEEHTKRALSNSSHLHN